MASKNQTDSPIVVFVIRLQVGENNRFYHLGQPNGKKEGILCLNPLFQCAKIMGKKVVKSYLSSLEKQISNSIVFASILKDWMGYGWDLLLRAI
jgi:hypothetical protein